MLKKLVFCLSCMIFLYERFYCAGKFNFHLTRFINLILLLRGFWISYYNKKNLIQIFKKSSMFSSVVLYLYNCFGSCIYEKIFTVHLPCVRHHVLVNKTDSDICVHGIIDPLGLFFWYIQHDLLWYCQLFWHQINSWAVRNLLR